MVFGRFYALKKYLEIWQRLTSILNGKSRQACTTPIYPLNFFIFGAICVLLTKVAAYTDSNRRSYK